jgi:hypothetical protein
MEIYLLKAKFYFWWRIFLIALFMTLGTELLILFFLSLTEEAMERPITRARLISNLARKINQLGPEKTADFLSFIDPQNGEIWLEDPHGNVVLGSHHPRLGWRQRLTLPEQIKSVFSDITVWNTGEIILLRAPTYLNGQNLFLFQAQKVFWRLTKRDHFIQGFIGLLLVSTIFSIFVVKRAYHPLSRLLTELAPLTQGELTGRVTAEGEGLVPSIARGINLLTRTLAAREESLSIFATVLAQGRALVAQSRLASGRLENWLDTGTQPLAQAQASLKDIGRAISHLDRLLGELILFHNLDFKSQNFTPEKVPLSILAFETSVRYQELAGSGGLKAQVASELYIRGNSELLAILLSRLLDGVLALTPLRPIHLILEKEEEYVVLSVQLGLEITLKDLEERFWLQSKKPTPLDFSLSLARKIADFSQAKTQTHRLENGLVKIEFRFLAL